MECEKNGERNEACGVEYGGVSPPTTTLTGTQCGRSFSITIIIENEVK
jgi:hypothetical protein